MADPKWKKFEKLIHALHTQLAPTGAIVTYDDHIMGLESGTERQIDISIRVTISGYSILIIIECKDWADPIGVEEMDAFSTKLKDVGANKGVIVSATGFTQPAQTAARVRGIETRRYFDTEGGEWRAEVSIPVLLSGIKPDGWFASFGPVPGHAWEFPKEKFSQIEVFTVDGILLGTVRALAARKWNDIGGPNEPGDHRYSIGSDLIIHVDGQAMHTLIDVTIRAKRHYYFGSLPIQAEGLIDEEKGTITTRNMATDFVNPSHIEKGGVPGWSEIADPAELSVRPVLTWLYADVLSETED